MRTATRVLASTALAALTLGGTATVTATTAHADGRPQPKLTVTPSHPRPGEHVELLFKDGGCTADQVTATSKGLEKPVHLKRLLQDAMGGDGDMMKDHGRDMGKGKEGDMGKDGGGHRPVENVFSGTGRVSPKAKPGQHYDVTIHCPGDGTFVLPGFTVRHGAPTKGAHAGEGGSIAGADTTGLTTGGALLALAAGGSVLALRRRARSNA